MRSPRLLSASLLLLVGGSFAPLASASAPPLARWLSASDARRTISLTLVAGYNGANNGFNFDGYGRGMLLVRVPLGWRVVVSCQNGASLRHSCAVVSGTETAQPAFRGAASASPLIGLLPGQTEHFAFTATRSGSYRLTSLVPGDEQARLWDLFEVGGVTRPAIATRTGF